MSAVLAAAPALARVEGLTAAFAQFIAHAGEALLAPAVADAARAAIGDCLGAAVAGSTEEVARIARTQAVAGACAVWGCAARVDVRDAALANGCAAHAHAIDDTSESMRGHPTAPVLPAAFALAEELDASGSDLLLAYVVGVEIEGKLGRAVNDFHAEAGWHTTCTLGSVGAAAACARLLRLDASRAAHALGIAASMASGLRVNFGTMTKALHAGLAAQNGLLAARLARDGMQASPLALEGHEGFLHLFGPRPTRSVAHAVAALGAPLDILSPGIVLKLYPTCSLMHALVDLVLEARCDPSVVREPSSILCRISLRLDRARGKRWPQSGLEARFHVEYCVATAWIRGTQGLGDFTDDAIGDSDVRALANRIRLEVDAGFPDGDYAELEIATASNGPRRTARAKPDGHPSRPLSEARRQEKFHGLAAPVLGTRRSDDLWAALGAIEATPVRRLAALLQPSAEP